VLRAAGRCHLVDVSSEWTKSISWMFSIDMDIFYFSSFIVGDDKCYSDASIHGFTEDLLHVNLPMMNMPRVQKSILSLGNVVVGGCMSRRVDTSHQRSCKSYVRFVDKHVQSPGVAELNPVSIYVRHVMLLLFLKTRARARGGALGKSSAGSYSTTASCTC
jgi:hypothetical protein